MCNERDELRQKQNRFHSTPTIVDILHPDANGYEIKLRLFP